VRRLDAKRLDDAVRNSAPADANAQLIANRQGYATAAQWAMHVEAVVIGLRAAHGYLVTSEARIKVAIARGYEAGSNERARVLSTIGPTCEHGDES
jgi:hypothetical protein